MSQTWYLFQFRDESYRQALFAINGAIVASLFRDFSRAETSTELVDIFLADQPERPETPIPRSAIYLELKIKQVLPKNCKEHFI